MKRPLSQRPPALCNLASNEKKKIDLAATFIKPQLCNRGVSVQGYASKPNALIKITVIVFLVVRQARGRLR